MTQKSSAELEREAEAVRSRMSETAETLQRKLSPGQLLDEIGTYFKNSDGALALDNLKTQVRDNPLPLALVGVGLAWLFMGGGPKADTLRHKMSGSGTYPNTDGSWPEESYGTSSFGSETSSESSATSALHSASERAHAAGQWASDAGRHASSRVQDAGSNLQRMVSDTLDQEPLIIGALGMAVGAAIGAMLPTTRAEEQVLRPYGQKARESAMDAMNSGLEQAKSAVSETVHSATEESSSTQDSLTERGQQ